MRGLQHWLIFFFSNYFCLLVKAVAAVWEDVGWSEQSTSIRAHAFLQTTPPCFGHLLQFWARKEEAQFNSHTTKDHAPPLKSPCQSRSTIPEQFQDLLHPFILWRRTYLSLPSCEEAVVAKHVVSRASSAEDSCTDISQTNCVLCSTNKSFRHPNSNLKRNYFLHKKINFM